MLKFWIILILIAICLFTFPKVLAYILGVIFLFFWFNIVLAKIMMSKKWAEKEDYVKFWNYKIYKD